jgi:uncharacterized protein YndB with AHSA1/START domain
MTEAVSQTPEQTGPKFALSRTFNAPREHVFQAWTDFDCIAHWWGPKGFPVHIAKLEARPGGLFHYSIELPGGQKMWGKFIYQEVTAPERLVYINSFSDEAEGMSRHPFSAEWPLELFNQVTFEDRDGQTTLHIQVRPHNANEAEQKAFEAGLEGMQQGFAGTMEQLEAYLSKS